MAALFLRILGITDDLLDRIDLHMAQVAEQARG